MQQRSVNSSRLTAVTFLKLTSPDASIFKFPIKGINKLLASYDNRVSNEEDSCARQEGVWGSGGAAPLIFNLDITYRGVISFSPTTP